MKKRSGADFLQGSKAMKGKPKKKRVELPKPFRAADHPHRDYRGEKDGYRV